MRIGVLSLQGDIREHKAALSDLGVATRSVLTSNDLSGVDGLILPGGESTAISMLLESSGLFDPLKKEIDAGMPVMGTCAGLILLSRDIVDGRPDQRSLGAVDLVVRRNGYGRQLQSFEAEIDTPVLGSKPLPAVFIRAPKVQDVGESVEVLAWLGPDFDPTGAERPSPIICKQSTVLVTAFHPELTEDRRLHEYFLSMVECRDQHGQQPMKRDSHEEGEY